MYSGRDIPSTSKLVKWRWSADEGFGAHKGGRGRTYILEAKELVAAVAAQRAGVDQQLLERGGFWGVGILLDRRGAGCWAGWGLAGERQYQPLRARGAIGPAEQDSQRWT